MCLQPDFWRLSNRTLTFARCQSDGPCTGGCADDLTGGTAYCRPGHNGPRCELCDGDAYYDRKRKECRQCSDRGSLGTLIGIVVFGTVVLLVFLHLSTADRRRTGKKGLIGGVVSGLWSPVASILGLAARLAHVFQLHTKLKIFISFAQVFTVIANV
jgi:hypothetical protein